MAKKEEEKEKKKKTDQSKERDETENFHPMRIATDGAGEPAGSQNYLKMIRQI